MPGGDFFIVMLLLWTFVGWGVDGERVTGVLHGRVELRGRYGYSPDLDAVEWVKYPDKNSTRKLLYLFNKSNNTTWLAVPQNINFNLQNMSLILFNLTTEDEGIYEEKTTFKNKTVKHFNVTLSLLFASNITVSPSNGSLTLKCEINGEFKLLRWFRNGLPLLDDQRFSLTDNNKTMQVSNLTSSDCGTYTCQVSNENGKSEAQINISGTMSSFCPNSTGGKFLALIEPVLFSAGFSLIGLLVLCIILILICKYYGRRKIKTASTEEPVYDEPTFLQEQAAAPTVDPLFIVYQDFIKPKDSHQSDQSKDFGYSTITDVRGNMQASETT
ncbi:hepatocyte cell adhesion molecule isoform X1 [Ictalurus punctatus]|uniref:Hepatocyte cell adhesion molecule isoform X1 n=1 Tax=Ictalurus punctatus TaxID=7998 RepID=A0A979FB90_ICTPU|nr:hepatocyte cell adhesion molecule isoform X1 [Ictalurus punctatus]XP_047017090.2 hepatocyte cell adhesion molecule isoform X1 [Ictalurus punctatus]